MRCERCGDDDNDGPGPCSCGAHGAPSSKRKWKFRIETDGPHSESIFVDAHGRHDEDARFIGTEAEASQEATRRCFAWEDRTGETPACIEYVSCGVANTQIEARHE